MKLLPNRPLTIYHAAGAQRDGSPVHVRSLTEADARTCYTEAWGYGEPQITTETYTFSFGPREDPLQPPLPGLDL